MDYTISLQNSNLEIRHGEQSILEAGNQGPKISVIFEVKSIFESIKAQFFLLLSFFYGERLTNLTVNIERTFGKGERDTHTYLATVASVDQYMAADPVNGLFRSNNGDSITKQTHFFDRVITITNNSVR